MNTLSKTVLITGSSSGFGLAAAELFAARGWNVAATLRKPEAFSDRDLAAKITLIKLDVTRPDERKSAVAETMERFGTIDVLVNNAGYGLFGPMEGSTENQFEAQFQTNVFGTAGMIREVLPIMRRNRSGTIVNVSSVGGRLAVPFGTGYYATKYALEGFSESLRFELAGHGIRVKLVEPGHFKTGFVSRSMSFLKHSAYQKEWDNYYAWMLSEDAKAPGPARVAEIIFEAANDSSDKLRYPVKARALLALKMILPDCLWRFALLQTLKRRPAARPWAPR